jgi:hypothetical protein
MSNKKRLYWNSCSFLDNDCIVDEFADLSTIFSTSYPDITKIKQSYKASIGGSSNESIFRRTLIECSKNHFDFALVAWSHPERYFITDWKHELDYNKLRADADSLYFPTRWDETHMYGYQSQIPHELNDIVKHTNILKLEPKGTDDTIFYTISLHNFFKQKGIPHLFLNMGKLDSDVLWARESWLNEIDPKNYLSINDNDTILQKMQFSFVEYFLKLDNGILMKDVEINRLQHLGNLDNSKKDKIYTSDESGHLTDMGYKLISKYICDYIMKHNLVL